jgi:hypothetical protein
MWDGHRNFAEQSRKEERHMHFVEQPFSSSRWKLKRSTGKRYPAQQPTECVRPRVTSAQWDCREQIFKSSLASLINNQQPTGWNVPGIWLTRPPQTGHVKRFPISGSHDSGLAHRTYLRSECERKRKRLWQTGTNQPAPRSSSLDDASACLLRIWRTSEAS